MIGGIVNKTREDEKEKKREKERKKERKRGREEERKKEERERERERGPPCVRSKRLRVYVQNVPVYAGTTRTCCYAVIQKLENIRCNIACERPRSVQLLPDVFNDRRNCRETATDHCL